MIIPVILAVPLGAAQAEPPVAAEEVLADLQGRLDLPVEVRIVRVDSDERLVSVRRSAEDPQVFELAFERLFLEQLTPQELRAVLAHELGHVYIFTHHPFLQTEELANLIARRVVGEADLQRVYAKVGCYREQRPLPPAEGSPELPAGTAGRGRN